MNLRPYQAKAVADCGDKFREGARGICIVSSVGSGKTLIGAAIVAAVVGDGKRVAWSAHREELLLQGARHLRALGLDVGFQGLGRGAPVQLGSYQRWATRGEMPDCDYFIADECHHLADHNSWQALPGAVRAAGKRNVGLSGSPARPDGRALPDYDALVVAAQIPELTRMGYLVPLRWRGPGAQMSKQRIALKPVEAYQAETPGESAIVFAASAVACKAFVADFLAAGISCEFVTSNKKLMSDEQRAETLGRFDRGETLVVVNVGILTEGFDCTRCSVVIVARGCESVVWWIQATGRALRTRCMCGRAAEGRPCSCAKPHATLLDLTGVAHTLGRPDAEARYSLDGAGIVLAADSCPTGERLCKVCRGLLGDAMVCPTCGKDHSPKVPKAVGAPLTDWNIRWDAAKAGTNASAMVKSLAGILHKASEAAKAGKPWSDAAPAMRFKAIFRRMPYAQEYQAARNFLRAAETYEPPQREMT
jgi:superfamily II DNA or RNA helicase